MLFTYDVIPEPADDLVLQPLALDAVLVVLPSQHRLARAALVPLSELRDERWVAGCSRCRAHLLSCTADAGYVPDIRHSTDDYVVTQTLVAAGLGVALLPELALNAARADAVTALPLDPPQHRRVYLAHRAGNEALPAVAAALDVLTRLARLPA